jgi:D-lyxose ketol-isomerase
VRKSSSLLLYLRPAQLSQKICGHLRNHPGASILMRPSITHILWATADILLLRPASLRLGVSSFRLRLRARARK